MRLPNILAVNLTYLVRDTNTIEDLKQSTPETLACVGIIDLSESEQRTFEFPLRSSLLFDPVSCDSKVTISIFGLPCITGSIDGALDSGTLHRSILVE